MYLPTDYQSFIHQSRYARWLPEENRRESWLDTVNRLISYYSEFANLDEDTALFLKDKVHNLEVMPSMRAMMTAGSALDRNHIAAYNCSYLPVDSPRAFDECMYILMHGTGVGFSVERQYVQQLPLLPDEFVDTETTIVVQDSKEGWQRGFKELINLLYAGQVPKWDMSRVRPAGARLKTIGGRASGPEPLKELFTFTINLFRRSIGQRLSCMDAHDLMCKIAEIVVVGGVRRSALISLSNLGDDRMRHAKSGQWWTTDPHRALSNNSVCYTDSIDIGTFMREWVALYESKSGERGIFNRQAAQKQVERFGRRDPTIDYGTNPCSEIILRPKQFCNLTEVVVRADDTFETLCSKIEAATILGTIQSMFTDFKGLSSKWKKNTEEERLLGVSLTGILDNEFMSRPSAKLSNMLQGLRNHAVTINKTWAEKFGIEQSAAVTCVKPSGTVSQLVDSASGIHPRHNPYYIRTVRADVKDPLTRFMIDSGIPHETCMYKPDSTVVFSFPMKSPNNAITRHDVSAIEHLKLWQMYATDFCEHKPSITVSVREDEWMKVGAYVHENFDTMSGISFLPMSEHTYEQAPYQDVGKKQYQDAKQYMEQKTGSIDWSKLSDYEQEDNTHGSQTLNCTGDVCEVVDIL